MTSLQGAQRRGNLRKMDFIELEVQPREEKGKSAARSLRREGLVPAVLYSAGNDTISLQLKAQDIARLLQHGNRNAILQLKGLPKTTTAMIKEIQKEATKDKVVHLDFLKVAMDAEVDTVVPIELVGEAIGVRDGGVMQHSIRELHIKALPKDIPEKYEVDVSELAVGSFIKVSDLKQLPGVTITATSEDHIVSVVPPTELKEEVVEELAEGEEAAEAGEEAPAEGEEQKEESTEESK